MFTTLATVEPFSSINGSNRLNCYDTEKLLYWPGFCGSDQYKWNIILACTWSSQHVWIFMSKCLLVSLGYYIQPNGTGLIQVGHVTLFLISYMWTVLRDLIRAALQSRALSPRRTFSLAASDYSARSSWVTCITIHLSPHFLSRSRQRKFSTLLKLCCKLLHIHYQQR